MSCLEYLAVVKNSGSHWLIPSAVLLVVGVGLLAASVQRFRFGWVEDRSSDAVFGWAVASVVSAVVVIGGMCCAYNTSNDAAYPELSSVARHYCADNDHKYILVTEHNHPRMEDKIQALVRVVGRHEWTRP